MQFLITALAIVLVSTTASAKPIGWPRHHDADIADNDLTQGWLDGNNRSPGSSRYEDSSSESRESSESSESSESRSSEESSQEDLFTDQTTPVVIDTATTTIATVDGSTSTPEPDTVTTDESTVRVTSPPPATPATPVASTSPGCVTHCFTVEIPTAAPITENRGDN
ncbi:uncharacterized protein PEZ65_019321 [Lycodopsis pacificus]